MALLKAKVSRAFVHCFWDVFDNLGYGMAVNFFTFLSFFTFFFYPFAIIGLLKAQEKIISNQPLFVREFIDDCKSCGWKPLLIFLFQIVLVSMGFFNITFYGSHLGAIGLFLLLCSLLVEGFLFVYFFFAYPLLLLGNTLPQALKLSFFLTIKHLKKGLLFLVIAVAITFIFSLSVVAVPLFLWAVLASFWGNLFDQFKRIEEGLEERALPEKTFKDVFFPFHQ